MLEAGSTIKSVALPGNGTGKILKKYVDRKGANGEDLYEIMDELGIRGKERKDYVDMIAAKVILQDYLNQRDIKKNTPENQ